LRYLSPEDGEGHTGVDNADRVALPTIATWYGYAKMKQALAEIKELDHQMRRWAAAKSAG
jgi:hypothetical protein